MTDGVEWGGRRTGKGIFSTPCRQATILQSSKCENSGNEHNDRLIVEGHMLFTFCSVLSQSSFK